MAGSLASAFFTHLPAPVRAGLEGAVPAPLDGDLGRALERARSAWPSLTLDPVEFAGYLGQRIPPQTDPARVSAALARLQVEDLYLAAACAAGDRAAIALFLRQFVPHIEAAVLGMGAGAAEVDEVREQMLEILLVAAPDRPPGIAGYAGRGRLRSWVRSIAVRTAMRQLGRRAADARGRAAGAGEALEGLPDLVDDPEVAHLKRRYGGALRTALGQALAGLDSHKRTLLRQHYIDELTVDQLGALHGVHRATAARWVAAARQELLDQTRRRMVDALGVGRSEFDSVVRLVRSQIDISIHDLLATSASPGGSD